jgi:hypothetical protein
MYDRYEAGPPTVDARVRVVYRERWRRTLVLTGDMDATVTYSGMGSGERVFLNGRLWAQTSIWSWQIVYPFVEFDLPARDRDVPARIDVRASLLPWRFGITRFGFSIAGCVLYDEEGRRDVWFRDDSGFVTDEPYEEDV